MPLRDVRIGIHLPAFWLQHHQPAASLWPLGRAALPSPGEALPLPLAGALPQRNVRQHVCHAVDVQHPALTAQAQRQRRHGQAVRSHSDARKIPGVQ